ncbi:MAG TPA: (2Fe-2S)-binding protein [Stellaceae bacterium]|nr:(2Fe-2S)-binding protein [Stellaceae bacterium]
MAAPVRVARLDAPVVRLTIDGTAVAAQVGESILIASLRARGSLQKIETAGPARAGFCLMGACQDCWVWLEGGRRVRSCTTSVAEGMQVFTGALPGFPRDA